jgi:hypothetical protein
MLTTAIKHLKPHPAQMRTLYDLDTLASLALQVYERGLDAWQPILAAQNETGFHIVSGHRRHMAQLLAFALQDWAGDHPDTPVTIEVARTMVQTLVESLGSLEALITSLLRSTVIGRFPSSPSKAAQGRDPGSCRRPITAARPRTRWASPTAFTRP